MKKFITIVLISCLVLGAAFATSNGDIKVGGQLGFNSTIIRADSTEMNATNKVAINGFLIEVDGQYFVTDAVSIKAEAGLAINGGATVNVTYHGETHSVSADPGAVSYAMYVGGQYDFDLGKGFTLGVGGGLDALFGDIAAESESESFNFGFGFAAEVVAAYSVNKNIDITLGGKFAWRFVNTMKEFNDSSFRTNGFGIQVFAGATYAF